MTLRQSELLALGGGRNFATDSFEVLTESYRSRASLLHKRAFLSHSHRDRTMAMGLKRKLAQVGIALYIDWLDLAMPKSTSVETAKKIQGEIRSCNYFLYLATSNSAKSMWCPWELGYADGITLLKNKIYIVPTMDGDNLEYGKEYLGLYRVMDMFCEKDGTEKFAYYDVQDPSKRYHFSV